MGRDLVLSLLLMLVPLVWLGGAVWAAFDATAHGRSGCLVGLLVVLTGPLGLLLYVAARIEIE